jgi:predicted lipase
METNDANKGQKKLYLLLCFIGHSLLYALRVLKALLFKAEIRKVLVLWTSTVKLSQFLCHLNAFETTHFRMLRATYTG